MARGRETCTCTAALSPFRRAALLCSAPLREAHAAPRRATPTRTGTAATCSRSSLLRALVPRPAPPPGRPSSSQLCPLPPLLPPSSSCPLVSPNTLPALRCRYLKRVMLSSSSSPRTNLDHWWLLCGKISLLGHSAGGWLARVYMAEFEASDISLLLTLGTPHLSPPKGVPGVIDQTRGLLNYIEKNCAPAVYTPELRYVCIAGRYIQGAPLLGNSAVASDEILAVDTLSEGGEAVIVSTNEKSTPSSVTWRAQFVGQGYKQVCGQADVWGDDFVPEMAAHLEGALNISFDGVYHSPVGSDDEERPWYGSPAILKQWVHHLLS